MAIVYDDTQMSQPEQTTWGDRISAHPIIAVVVALIFAVGIGYVIYQIRNGQSSSGSSGSTGNTGTATSGVNSNGQQVVYVPTSNTFLDYANFVGNNDTTTTTNTTNNTTNTSNVTNNTTNSNNITTNPPPVTPPKPVWNLTGAPPNQLWDSPYIVQQGDTLSSIADILNGQRDHDRYANNDDRDRDRHDRDQHDRIDPSTIYSFNKTNIDALDNEYGATGGPQLYPGQAIWLPFTLQR